MLGFEVPARMSCSFTTASFGIAKSLVKSDIKSYFVIPKTDKEAADNK